MHNTILPVMLLVNHEKHCSSLMPPILLFMIDSSVRLSVKVWSECAIYRPPSVNFRIHAIHNFLYAGGESAIMGIISHPFCFQTFHCCCLSKDENVCTGVEEYLTSFMHADTKQVT